MVGDLSLEGATGPRFLLRDRDSKLTRAFDDVFAADGTKILKTPVEAPNANAHAERWVRTVRQKCLDWLLIWGRRHLERVLDEYVRHYNRERPPQSLELRAPTTVGDQSHPGAVTAAAGIERRDRLGAWFMSITRPQHDIRVSEPYGTRWAQIRSTGASPGPSCTWPLTAAGCRCRCW